jgi:hypothetical protein
MQTLRFYKSCSPPPDEAVIKAFRRLDEVAFPTFITPSRPACAASVDPNLPSGGWLPPFPGPRYSKSRLVARYCPIEDRPVHCWRKSLLPASLVFWSLGALQ